MRRRQKFAPAWAMLVVLTPVACTGSPATLSMRPDFEVTTSIGTANVSIREPLPGLTYDESERLLRGVGSREPVRMPSAVLRPGTLALTWYLRI
jgi:hypothetical protein